jgi:hypothetical protein
MGLANYQKGCVYQVPVSNEQEVHGRGEQDAGGTDGPVAAVYGALFSVIADMPRAFSGGRI